MEQIEITDSAKSYLDAIEERIGDDDTDGDYSLVVNRLQGRSWDASQDGGRITLNADDIVINVEETNQED